MAEILYFVDGYHGGIEGHMPDGSWADIMDAMERYPAWKLSLEIEPDSWDVISDRDPVLYRKVKEFIEKGLQSGRIEFISGAYGQPFCWAISGESNIRQLIRGQKRIHQHFPAAVIDTYGVQEPCFASMLPQICKKLGYRRISLKNPTAWGGYMRKMPGSVIRLYSADGSWLPAVPRYDCEELTGCSATEGSGYDRPSILSFADKCVKCGIPHPVGLCLQDLGWKAHPLLEGLPVEYVTWREYFERFGKDPQGEVFFHPEDVLCTLPWGNQKLQKMCRKVRTLEDRLLRTEKLMALAAADGMETEACRDTLTEAWDDLLRAQHHDGYICATTPGSPFGSWEARAEYLTRHGCSLLEKIENRIFGFWNRQVPASSAEEERYIRVYNTLGNRRIQQAEIVLSLSCGCHGFQVTDETGAECPAQWQVLRSYEDGSPAAVRLRFLTDLQGIGYRTYRAEFFRDPGGNSAVGGKPAEKERGIVKFQDASRVELETDRLFIRFDLTRGGGIVSLLDRESGREYVVPGKTMGTLKGYFVEEGKFCSNDHSPAVCEVLWDGPLSAALKLRGQFHEVSFETLVEVRAEDSRIDFVSTVDFPQETRVGYPYLPPREEEFDGRKRSASRGDYKLGVQIPIPFRNFDLWKHAPYEIARSREQDTRFEGWGDIKHTILHEYVDFYQEQQDCGLAVLCDHLNGYSLVEGEFLLTHAFGYHAGFWWGNQPLQGKSQIGYSLYVHQGNYEKGRVPQRNSEKKEGLYARLLPGKPPRTEKQLFYFPDPDLEVVTILQDGKQYLVRAFHHGFGNKEARYLTQLPDFVGRKTDLWGNPLEESQQAEPGKLAAGVFEIITLK